MRSTTAVLAVVTMSLAARPVAAHIHLLEPLSRTDNMRGDPQKTRHCGDSAVTRIASRVTTYAPGQTVTVKWAETINHKGWYRISFQANGETFRIPPASNGAAGDGSPSNYPTEDLTGMVDPGGTGSIILKDRIPTATHQWDITFPNIECSNCTLQLIMMMTDNKPYDADVTTDADANDLYYQCADITLSANAPDAGVVSGADAGTGAGPDAGTTPPDSGGCSAGGCGWPGLSAWVLFAARRWRRKSVARRSLR
jgi:hypothetical protein